MDSMDKEIARLVGESKSEYGKRVKRRKRLKAGTDKWIERYNRENKKKSERFKRSYGKSLDMRVRSAVKSATMPKRKND